MILSKILNYKYIGIICLGIFCILLPKFSYAIAVPVNYMNRWDYSKYFDLGGCGGGVMNGDFSAKTTFNMALSKQFDLLSNRLGGLNQNESRIIFTGENITAINYDVTGSYSYTSADQGTPNMDDQINYWEYRSRTGACGSRYFVKNRMRGGISSQLGYTLSSSDNSVIDCSSGTSCIAKNQPGTATITVSFPGEGSYYLERAYDFGNYVPSFVEYEPPCNRGDTTWYNRTKARNMCVNVKRVFLRNGGTTAKKAWNYTLNSINYNLTVEVPNQAPTVKYKDTIDISYNTAKANWEYQDPEGDLQTDIEVEVYTNSNYTDEEHVFKGNVTGTNESVINITGLTPGTTYYPRVRGRDSKGSWSGWSNGTSFITRLNNNNPPNLDQLSCGAVATGYTTGIINWEYTGTDEVGDELILKARWKINRDDTWTENLDIPPNTRKGNVGISNLVSGSVYDIEVSLNDNRNAHLGDRWKSCGELKIQNSPEQNLVSCSIDGGRKSVSASNPNISITATLNGNYALEAGVNTNDETQNSKSGPSTANTQQIELDYTGLAFGRYQPWVKIKDTTVKAICGTITNFGSSQIREVNP